MKYTFCWVLAALLTEVYCHRLTGVVTTDKGAVRGRQMKTVLNGIRYSAFLRMPFAKPPVCDLRFRDPIEADPWTGVLNATEDSDKCVQYSSGTPEGSEDCLYLNVFTPVLNFTKIEKLLPVMVWVYGGSFLGGSISRESFGPDLFLENNVIFVNMNYRLGPLGFLGLNMNESRGNQGLKDQNMAMRWVQKNIAKFGGDPNQVTLFGESAGADSVMYHLISPQSKGLFQQVISQSGSPICPWGFHTPKSALQAGKQLGKYMGITAETNEQLLDALKKADIADIIKAVVRMVKVTPMPPLTLPFNPTIEVSSASSSEEAFLDDCPISKFQSGNFIRIPTMLGYNKEEIDPARIDPVALRKNMEKRLNKLFALDPTGLSKGFTGLLNTVATGTLSELAKTATAFYFTGPIDSTQQMLAKYNGKIPVYYYRLSYWNQQNGHNDTAHADDIPLLFTNESAPHLDPNSEYNVYRTRLVSLWTNFAKYGNPTPNGHPINGAVWLPSGKEGRQINLGNKEFKMHGRLLDLGAQEFASFYTSILPAATACVNHAWNPLSPLPYRI